MSVRETICIFQYRVNKYDLCANRGFVDYTTVKYCVLTAAVVIHSLPGRYSQHAWFLFLEYGLHCFLSELFSQTILCPCYLITSVLYSVSNMAIFECSFSEVIC